MVGDDVPTFDGRAVQARQGWYPDPSGAHEWRYFSAGGPSELVRDGDRESYDAAPGGDDGWGTTPSGPIEYGAPSPWVGLSVAGTETSLPGTAPRRRWLAVAAAVILVGAGVSGIAVATHGGGSTDAATVIRASPAATQRAGTARFTTSIRLSSSGYTAPVVTMSGRSDFAHGATEMHLGGAGGVSSTVLVVGGVEYFQSSAIKQPAGTHWVKILPQDLGIGASQAGLPTTGDPTEGLQFLGAAVGEPVVVGEENIDGVATTRYEVNLDLVSMVDKLSQAGSQISAALAGALRRLQATVDMAHVPGEVWLDAQDRVRRFTLTLNLQTADLHGTEIAISEVETTTFSDFGTPVNVTAPAPSDTCPFSSVTDQFSPPVFH